MKYSFINSARGIAILMVIMTHVSQLYMPNHPIRFLKFMFEYCQMGVQLFFIASAFTLCNSHENRKQESKPLRNFYIRRLFRIFPIYYLGIILYLILNYYLKSINNYTSANILNNILFLHGLVPSANNSIVPGGWSIGTEMLFYLIFPFLIKFFYSGKFLLKSILIICLCYTIVLIAEVRVLNNNFWYFNILVQLPVFIIGIIYYKFNSHINYFLGICIFVFFSAISAFLWFNKIFIFIPLISGVSFCGLLKILENTILNAKIFQKIGMVSYSIYITHFIFAFYIFDVTNSLVTIFLYFVISLLLCYFSGLFLEKYIEKTFIRLGQKIINQNN